jgi:glutathione S-transferase
MTGYVLYGAKGTGSFAPQVFLELAQAPYQFHNVDLANGEQRSEAFLAVNPHGKVPALRLPDGTVITESAAMMLHFGERFPACGLLPPEASVDRAQVQRWMVFMAANIYETCLRAFYSERFTTLPETADGVRDAANAALAQQWRILEAALNPGPYLLGRQRSIADIYMLMLAPWTEITKTLANVQRTVAALVADPLIKPLWIQHTES